MNTHELNGFISKIYSELDGIRQLNKEAGNSDLIDGVQDAYLVVLKHVIEQGNSLTPEQVKTLLYNQIEASRYQLENLDDIQVINFYRGTVCAYAFSSILLDNN